MTKHDPLAALPPGSTVGILGGGQLGRMLAQAAAELGLRVHIYAPEETSPAAEVAANSTRGDYEDGEKLRAFAESVDIVTYEFENVPGETARILSEHTIVRPNARSLAVSQDRLEEKNFLKSLGIETAPFAAVDTLADLEAALTTLGLPAILKTRRFGYDGKGQVKIERAQEAKAAFEAIKGAPAILEGFVPFEKEVSVIAGRAPNGDFAAYDVGENVHRHHILHTTTVPAALSHDLAAAARDMTQKLMDGLDYVGVIGVEFFVVTDQSRGTRLCVNEFAPRVHNSGHWTMDACSVSQFEQHIRAICGWPLGTAERHSDAVMLNLIGTEIETWATHAATENCSLHLYGKHEPRPGRKMGHITTVSARSGR